MSIPAVLVLLAVMSLALVALPGYIWWRLVRSTTQPGRSRRRLTVLTVVLAALPLAADALNRVLPEEVATPLEWVAYSWLGVALYLVLALLALQPVRLMLRRLQRRRAPAPGPPPAQQPADAAPSRAPAPARRDEAPPRQQQCGVDRGESVPSVCSS